LYYDLHELSTLAENSSIHVFDELNKRMSDYDNLLTNK